MPHALAQAEHHAGMVLQFADGHTRTYCLAFAGDTISGLDLLLKTGLEVKVEAYGGMGGQICKLGPDGCDYPEQPCACQSYGPGGVYWSYSHLKNGAWKSSGQGASSYKVRDGDIEGWAWSSGKGPNVAPALAQLCPNLQLAQPEPTVEPQPPTVTPEPPPPTNTAQPTAAPPPPPSATPHPVESRPPTVAPPSATPSPLIAPSREPGDTPLPTLAPTEQPTQPAPPTPTSTPVPSTPTEAPTLTSTDTPAPSPTETPLATSTPTDTPTPPATTPPTEHPTDTVEAASPTAITQPTPAATQAPTGASASPQALAQMVAVGIALIVAGGLLLVRYVRTGERKQP